MSGPAQETPPAKVASLLSVDEADHIASIDVSSISAIIRLASLGMSPADTHQYAVDINDGRDPSFTVSPGEPRPIVIQAWSFVKDRGQYESTYGLTSAQAAELSDLLLSDPDAAVKEIRSIVAARQDKRGSTRPVVVTLAGAPTGGVPLSVAGPHSDGGRAQLKLEIPNNSGVYGAYRFEAHPTGRTAGQSFMVKLGGGLCILGQSKEVAVAAARIVSVKGRHDPLVAPYVFCWLSGSNPVGADDMSKKIWDGRHSPGDALPAEPSRKDKTVAPSEGGTYVSPPGRSGQRTTPPADVAR